jgi:hypothetical protein
MAYGRQGLASASVAPPANAMALSGPRRRARGDEDALLRGPTPALGRTSASLRLDL